MITEEDTPTKKLIKQLRKEGSQETEELLEDFASLICREHRTHQSDITRNLKFFCDTLKKKMEDLDTDGRNRGTDGRNECALKWLSKVTEIDQPIPRI